MTSRPGVHDDSTEAFSRWLQERLEDWVPAGAGSDGDRAVGVVLFSELEDAELGDLNEELDPVVWREQWSGQILGQTLVRGDRRASHLSWDHALQEQESVVVATLDAGSSRAGGVWAAWLDDWLSTEAPRNEEGGAWNLARDIVDGPLREAMALMRAVHDRNVALPWYLSLAAPGLLVDKSWHRALNSPETLAAFAQEFADVAASH